jgi:hypothetical protein
MTEIQLPCCDKPARVDMLEDTIRCESCGIEFELAGDEPTSDRAAA